MARHCSAPGGTKMRFTPWNVPLHLLIVKLGPALATGNTIVLKPPPETPWTATTLGRIIAERTDIPAGVVNVVASADHQIGEQLVKSVLIPLGFQFAPGVLQLGPDDRRVVEKTRLVNSLAGEIEEDEVLGTRDFRCHLGLRAFCAGRQQDQRQHARQDARENHRPHGEPRLHGGNGPLSSAER